MADDNRLVIRGVCHSIEIRHYPQSPDSPFMLLVDEGSGYGNTLATIYKEDVQPIIDFLRRSL